MERLGMADPQHPQPGPVSSAPTEGIAPLVAVLAELRRRARLLLLAAAMGLLLSAALAAGLLLGILDFFLRTPAWMRLAVLVGGLAALAWGVRQLLLPAWRFRPALTEVALRLERSGAGRAAGLPGVLASGLELALDPPQSATSRGMAQQVIERARRAAAGVRTSAILDPTRARHGLLALSVCLVGLVATSIMVGPALMTTGAVRLLAPWAGAEWPKRTGVVDATTLAVHPLGTALPLRAAVVRADRAADQMRVAARYRLVTSEAGANWRRVMLASQAQVIAVETPGQPDAIKGHLFERLIEPSALAAAAGVDPALVTELEYWFETDDDRTRPRRIKLVQPPSVVSARVAVMPPEYARAMAASSGRSGFFAGQRELGPGNDQRAVVGPVLAGSRIEVQIELNKPVPPPPEGDGENAAAARQEWIAGMLGGIEERDEVSASFNGKHWSLGWVARRSMRIAIDPADEYGIRKLEEAAYSFDVIEDRPPSATIVEPREDESVLPTALVELAGEGRDDVGIDSIAMERQLARPPAGSAGAGAEPSGDPHPLATRQWSGEEASPAQVTLKSSLDLSTLDLRPRDELWITALVQDNYLGFEGARHEAVRSTPRKLRIISEEELIEQVRTELSALRRVAMRLDEEQGQMQGPVRAGEISGDDARRQTGLTQRIGQQTGAVERMMQRLERNRLQDEALQGLLEDVDSLFRGAAGDSDRAGSQMTAATRNEEEAAELDPQEVQQILEAQEAVRDQLGRMAQMLDRGEDSWVMSRALQRLLQQQRDVQAQTERLGERTMGRRASDLSPEERGELERLRERQQQLSEAARQALDALEERARQLQEADAAQAAAMEQAAQRGRQQQVPQRMEEAGQNLQQNQTSTATAQQQEAIEALEQMVQDMNDAQRQRDQALRRLLASLIESIQKLVADQREQIEALAHGIATNAYDGLDSGMIALNQSTLAVADKARSDRSTASVAEPIGRAARAQSDAVAALRASPVNAGVAQQHEQESLRLLMEALDEARRLEQEAAQRDRQRQRDELRRIYREALEEQVAVRGQTEPFIGRQIDRRQRMDLRTLGERQEALRRLLEETRKETEEFEEAAVFAFAHQRLESATGSAAKKMRAGQADHSVQRSQDSAVRILSALVEALSDAQRDDEFRDEESTGGGGGAQSGRSQLLPPIAELRLLRGMQQEAADVTRALDDSQDPSAREELTLLGELQRGLAERGRELIQRMQQNQMQLSPVDGDRQ
jgi:hypothetical protein